MPDKLSPSKGVGGPDDERNLGPYRLIHQIAIGGMAEIYLAKTRGIAGFEKFLALKLIHPNFAQDESFIQMLIDEAKIAVQLQHGNIVQIFDLGRVDQRYYIAMEFVDGCDLFRILRIASERNIAMPVELGVYVARELCQGLDYAHNRRDGLGRALGIIHRDISPQNVLISVSGEVKLVDFGIAKASRRLQRTDAGVIKGKYNYMSPEQAWGDTVDHRSDIFSCGILLYEMLAGQMLYLDEDMTRLLHTVRKAMIAPPGTLRKEVPHELDAVVMRALARRPDDRFATAQEFGAALDRFLLSYARDTSASHLAAFVESVMGEERHPDPRARVGARETREIFSRQDYRPDREHSVLFDLGAGGADSRGFDEATLPRLDLDDSERTVITGPPDFQAGAQAQDLSDAEETLNFQRPPALAPLPRLEDDSRANTIDRIAPMPSPGPPRLPSVGGDFDHPEFSSTSSVTPLAHGFGRELGGERGGESDDAFTRAETVSEPFLPSRPSVRSPADSGPLQVQRADRSDQADRVPRPGLGSDLGHSAALSNLPPTIIARPSLIAIVRDSWQAIAVGAAGVAVAAIIALAGHFAPRPPIKGRIKVTSVPPGATLKLDGAPSAERTPAVLEEVDRSRAHTVEVALPGYLPNSRPVTFDGQTVEVQIIAVLQPEMGTLDISSEPAGAEIFVNGRPAGATPSTVSDVPLGESVAVELRLRGYRAYREVIPWSGGHQLKRHMVLHRSR